MLTDLEKMQAHLAREFNIEKQAAHLLTQHGLAQKGWTFAWNKRNKAFGLCNYLTKTIELSTPLFALTTDTSAFDTLLHELAHALAPRGAGHGPKWRAACRLVGANPVRTKSAAQAMTAENEAIHTASFKYTATCPRCGYSFGQSRAVKATTCCGKCHKREQGIMVRFVTTQNR